MSGRVLIVDDDPMFCRLADLLLSQAGYTCACVETSRGALRVVRDFDPQCIVLDCHLGPPRSGLNLLPRLLRRLSGAPVVMVSADPAWDLAAEAIRDGAFVFWRKTADHAGLLEAVAAALQEHTLRLAGGDATRSEAIDSEAILDFHQDHRRDVSHTSRAIQYAWRRMLDRYDRAVGE